MGARFGSKVTPVSTTDDDSALQSRIRTLQNRICGTMGSHEVARASRGAVGANPSGPPPTCSLRGSSCGRRSAPQRVGFPPAPSSWRRRPTQSMAAALQFAPRDPPFACDQASGAATTDGLRPRALDEPATPVGSNSSTAPPSCSQRASASVSLAAATLARDPARSSAVRRLRRVRSAVWVAWTRLAWRLVRCTSIASLRSAGWDHGVRPPSIRRSDPIPRAIERRRTLA